MDLGGPGKTSALQSKLARGKRWRNENCAVLCSGHPSLVLGFTSEPAGGRGPQSSGAADVGGARAGGQQLQRERPWPPTSAENWGFDFKYLCPCGHLGVCRSQ